MFTQSYRPAAYPAGYNTAPAQTGGRVLRLRWEAGQSSRRKCRAAVR